MREGVHQLSKLMGFRNGIIEVGAAELFFQMEWGELGIESCDCSSFQTYWFRRRDDSCGEGP